MSPLGLALRLSLLRLQRGQNATCTAEQFNEAYPQYVGKWITSSGRQFDVLEYYDESLKYHAIRTLGFVRVTRD